MPDTNSSEEWVTRKIEDAKAILKDIGLPTSQQNDRSALTLLALLGLKPDEPWDEASNPLIGITSIMKFIAECYDKKYKPNTREVL